MRWKASRISQSCQPEAGVSGHLGGSAAAYDDGALLMTPVRRIGLLGMPRHSVRAILPSTSPDSSRRWASAASGRAKVSTGAGLI